MVRKTNSMPRTDLATYRLGHLRDAWAVHCRRSGLNASEGMRNLLQSVLAKKPRKPSANLELPASTISAPEKLTIRLNRREIRDAEAFIGRLGIKSINRWIVGLVRAQLYAEPILSDPELEALVNSTGELRAIGRNLNQIARHLNYGEPLEHGSLDVLTTLNQHIDAHTKSVTAILSKNVSRWRRSR